MMKMSVFNRLLRALFLLVVALLSSTLSAQSMDGAYSGTLDVTGQMKLNLTFRFSDGKCTMDVMEQGVKGLPIEVKTLTKDSVFLSSSKLGINYKGAITEDEIKGLFMQSGLTLPLNLKKGEIKVIRPQEPQGMALYASEEVTFTNPADGATLSGTLTYPLGWGLRKKTCPVVLMVTGSGQQNRDEEIMNHRPFLVLADRLAKLGIATLRYDDRGFGKSTGELKEATTRTFADDAEAGIKYLRSLKKFTKVGVLGHSEGGTIGFMLGEKKIPDFIVSLAGPAVRGIEISIEQNRLLLAQMGKYEEITEETIRKEIQNPSPWISFFLDYDPSTAIKACECPVMAVNGTKDFQVNYKQNLHKIKELLPANNKSLIKEYDGLNHLFQHAKTGLPAEYGQIEETMSEEVMSDIAHWILEL